jgi:hypothetical protein
LVAKSGWKVRPIRPRSPFWSTVNWWKAVGRSTPFLITRTRPAFSATKMRPSGACAKVVGGPRPGTHVSLREKPAGRREAPPKVTVMRDHADDVAGRIARPGPRKMCWPCAYGKVSTATEYGGLVTSLPTLSPSTWNSTPTTPTLSDAVAVRVTVPFRFCVRSAGDRHRDAGRLRVGAAAGADVHRYRRARRRGPWSSVATAVSTCVPVAAGVQEKA